MAHTCLRVFPNLRIHYCLRKVKGHSHGVQTSFNNIYFDFVISTQNTVQHKTWCQFTQLSNANAIFGSKVQTQSVSQENLWWYSSQKRCCALTPKSGHKCESSNRRMP